MVEKTTKFKSTTILIIVVSVLVGVCAWFNRILISDALASFFSKITPETSKVAEDVGFTNYGRLVFSATNANLENRDNFNERCKSHDQDISVLGCYTNGHIYIYDIKNDDLKGIVESTAAHELLHAIWDRLDASEKNRLSKYLLDVYNDDKYHEMLAEGLENYNEAERIDELHSRIGTEIAELPEELEKHYARYFTNQDLVVDFYNSYIEPFKELAEEIEKLSAELEKLDTEIEARTKTYYENAHNLAAQIEEFNNCAGTAGCFISQSIFQARRNVLQSAQNALNEEFNVANELVEKYNSLVTEYNENVIRGDALEKAINSNSEMETIK